jgi:hypothetical protein
MRGSEKRSRAALRRQIVALLIAYAGGAFNKN